MSDALLFREHEVEDVDEWPGRLDDLGESSLLWIDLEHPSDDKIDELAQALELDDDSVRRLEKKRARRTCATSAATSM